MSTLAAMTVPVDLGPRSYDIIIGDRILGNPDSYLAPIIGASKVHIVTDENVYALHGNVLEQLSCDYAVTVLPAGENQKSFTVLQKVLNAALEQGLGRNDVFIAFGGGVIGDLTGFAASVYKRGCRFIQIPTTLLAQVDSSVGGKTAINVPQGKNLIGAFYQPSLVLTDISVLKTLPERQIKAGYAEILKYGLLGDRAFFEWLEEHGKEVLSLSPESTARAIAVSCTTKARIVAEDELERGSRALLNLGHTFGHALEAEAGYSGDLLHGEAVSAGMDMAFAYSAGQGLCRAEDAARIDGANEKQCGTGHRSESGKGCKHLDHCMTGHHVTGKPDRVADGTHEIGNHLDKREDRAQNQRRGRDPKDAEKTQTMLPEADDRHRQEHRHCHHGRYGNVACRGERAGQQPEEVGKNDEEKQCHDVWEIPQAILAGNILNHLIDEPIGQLGNGLCPARNNRATRCANNQQKENPQNGQRRITR